MAFSVPELPYEYNALEPHIDEQTMRLHHDKHHAAYVQKLNTALEDTEWLEKTSKKFSPLSTSCQPTSKKPFAIMVVGTTTTAYFGK